MAIVSNVKPAISPIFTAATHLSFHQQSPVAVRVHLASCPGHARVRKGWSARGFELRKRSQMKTKRNSSCWKMNCDETTWKTIPKLRISVFWKPNRGNRVFGFWILRSVRVGSVFRKPISKIFIGFRTPLITATKCILQITEQPMQTTNSTHSPHQVECSAGLRYHQQVSSEVWWPNSWQTKPSYSVAVLHHTLHQLARHTSVSCHTSVTSSPASEAHPSCWTPVPTGCHSDLARLSDRTTTHSTWVSLPNGISLRPMALVRCMGVADEPWRYTPFWLGLCND